MQVLDGEPQETIHLFVISEDQLPRKTDYPSILIAAAAFLCILAILGISVFSAAPAESEVSFTIFVPGFHLAPVSKTVKTTVIATGKGHISATTATGIITFYNGLPYTQIVPIDTKLIGADGISVITDADAVIPPVAKTSPPTDGHVNVPAHALVAGVQGNIPAGKINLACCATSIIAQNPYNFSGGRNARDFTYLASQDITKITTSFLPALQTSTLSLLPKPQLSPHCSPAIHSEPAVGKETQSAQLTIIETCSAASYYASSVAQAITAYSRKFGKGTLAHVQCFVVGSAEKKGVTLTLYVVGRWYPFVMRSFPSTGK